MRSVFGIMVGSCMSCGTLKSPWVKGSIVLDGHLIVEHVSDHVHDAARTPPHAVVPAHNRCEGGAQHDASLGNEGEGDGGGLEVGGYQCLGNDLRKLSVSPSEWRFITAQVSTRWSFSILTVRSTTEISVVGVRGAWMSCVS